MNFSSPDDEGWFICEVIVEVQGFSGEYQCYVWLPDLECFHQELIRMIEQLGQPSTANLTTTEPGIDLHFSMNKSGHIEGQYAFENFDTAGCPKLSGVFQMDQSYLAGLVKQIAKLLHP
jgi:hypothetical protein